MKLIRRKQTAKMQRKESITVLPVISSPQAPDASASGVILFQRNPLVLVEELVVLPHRVARPVFRQEDAPQVGMVLEADAVHVIGLALVPVGRLVERDETRHDGVL